MIPLDFNDAMLTRASRAAVAFEHFGNLVGFVRRKAVHEAHDARAASFTRHADHAVGGHRGFGHAILVRMHRLGIFCGAHAGREGRYRALAGVIADALIARGWGVVYGGGRVGMMGSIADAMMERGGEVIGVIPRSLATAEVAHDGITQLHVVESMHERKALMAQLSGAFIALPGGYGTMDEFHEIVTWRQLGIHDKPIGLLNPDGFYDHLLAQYDRMLAEGFLSQRTRALFVTAPAIEELLAQLS